MDCIDNFDKCLLCNTKRIRVHQLENTKVKHGNIIGNKIFFCSCYKCDSRYLIEIANGINAVRVYKVSDLIKGKLK